MTTTAPVMVCEMRWCGTSVLCGTLKSSVWINVWSHSNSSTKTRRKCHANVFVTLTISLNYLNYLMFLYGFTGATLPVVRVHIVEGTLWGLPRGLDTQQPMCTNRKRQGRQVIWLKLCLIKRPDAIKQDEAEKEVEWCVCIYIYPTYFFIFTLFSCVHV